jgi:hypothetical protein
MIEVVPLNYKLHYCSTYASTAPRNSESKVYSELRRVFQICRQVLRVDTADTPDRESDDIASGEQVPEVT